MKEEARPGPSASKDSLPLAKDGGGHRRQDRQDWKGDIKRRATGVRCCHPYSRCHF